MIIFPYLCVLDLILVAWKKYKIYQSRWSWLIKKVMVVSNLQLAGQPMMFPLEPPECHLKSLFSAFLFCVSTSQIQTLCHVQVWVWGINGWWSLELFGNWFLFHHCHQKGSFLRCFVPPYSISNGLFFSFGGLSSFWLVNYLILVLGPFLKLNLIFIEFFVVCKSFSGFSWMMSTFLNILNDLS